MADVFRTPDERFEALPGYDFEPHYVDVDGLRVHYVDEGEGRPVVCFHGEPTWAYLYRKVARPLLDAGERVVVVDMPGFGRSDKPTEIGWGTSERHCAPPPPRKAPRDGLVPLRASLRARLLGARAPRPAGRDRGGAGLGRRCRV